MCTLQIERAAAELQRAAASQELTAAQRAAAADATASLAGAFEALPGDHGHLDVAASAGADASAADTQRPSAESAHS